MRCEFFFVCDLSVWKVRTQQREREGSAPFFSYDHDNDNNDEDYNIVRENQTMYLDTHSFTITWATSRTRPGQPDSSRKKMCAKKNLVILYTRCMSSTCNNKIYIFCCCVVDDGGGLIETTMLTTKMPLHWHGMVTGVNITTKKIMTNSHIQFCRHVHTTKVPLHKLWIWLKGEYFASVFICLFKRNLVTYSATYHHFKVLILLAHS